MADVGGSGELDAGILLPANFGGERPRQDRGSDKAASYPSNGCRAGSARIPIFLATHQCMPAGSGTQWQSSKSGDICLRHATMTASFFGSVRGSISDALFSIQRRLPVGPVPPWNRHDRMPVTDPSGRSILLNIEKSCFHAWQPSELWTWIPTLAARIPQWRNFRLSYAVSPSYLLHPQPRINADDRGRRIQPDNFRKKQNNRY